MVAIGKDQLRTIGLYRGLCIIIGLDLDSVATAYPCDGFKRIQNFSHQRVGKAGMR